MRSFSLKEAVNHSKRLQELGVFGKRSSSPDQAGSKEHDYVNPAEDDAQSPPENPPIQEQCPTGTAGELKPKKAIPIIRKPDNSKPTGPTLRPKKAQPPLPAMPPETAENREPCSADLNEGSATPEMRVKPKSQPFEERYERITTYLEKPLFHRVHNLHQRGKIAKIASLLNASVREYLERHYPGE